MKVLSIVCLAISVLQIQGASSLRGRKLVKDTEKPLKDGLLCGSIITVSTKLDTDLICDCTSASALTLSGEEINLDLGLHTVTCNAGSRDAIAVSGKANVVRNGSVKHEGAGRGILLVGGDHEVYHVEIGPTASGDGIYSTSDRIIISKNTIKEVGANVSPGSGTGRAIFVKGSDANIIEGNTITKAGDHGIIVEQSYDSKVQNNIVQESGGVGVFILGLSAILCRETSSTTINTRV